jgi:signal transduction histidine kinase
MQWLPPLSVETSSWRLPLSDRSANVLACLLCRDERDDAVVALTAILRIDPPLALWVVCRAKDAGVELRDVAGLAAWLVERLPEELAEAHGGEAGGAMDKPSIEQYADRVGASIRLADMAAALAVEEGEQAVEKAYLAGLLHESADWGRLTGDSADGGAKSFASLLPSWLVASEVNPWVGEVLASHEERLPGGSESVAQAVECWAASLDGGTAPVGRLAARLARLKVLEDDFQGTLEAEKLEAMAEFAAGAGHEINNPLAVIAGRAQLLLREETDPERRRTFALMNTQAKRVYEMIADMMLFARPPKPKFEDVELVSLVDGLVEDLQPRMTEQAVSLVRVGGDEPVTLEADPTQLSVAIRAMCRNSLEAIGHDGRIELELEQSDETVILRVSDDGPGISDEARRHLFDPYYSERQAGRGLGLGLSKCWRIVVTNHGGSIGVESGLGRGAVFSITLPRRQEA